MRALILLVAAVMMGQSAAPQAPPAKSTTAAPDAKTAPKSAPKSAPAAKATLPVLSTDEQKTIYALGLQMYRSLGQFDLSPAEVELIKRALGDAAAGKPAVDVNEWGPKFQAFEQARAARVAEKQKAGSNAYLAKAATEPGAIKTESGLIYTDLRPGSGASPKASDSVKVNYRGTLIDGTEFDSSYQRNQPAQFPLSGVIHCWTEGVQKMKVGGKARLVCPSEIAYGDKGHPPVIPGGATLIFEIELLEINGH
ncbi:MAG TPA: FKBP-type peptidyl-prolyl cis-trans isomerase [Bryobacteraceae bacterium]|jgi:FKBP-type peptidyl-prolyl cis-trans isomerase FkpA|nr:FKBP-type peptidyl-prolyl cis-trans isomerase [Bryobacteraceae bacterium]